MYKEKKNVFKRVTLSLEKIGNNTDWFLVIDKPEEQERGWIIGRKEEVEAIIEKLRKL